jgi:squalene-hopene/tetraprenyl-beta-curcumene cyclase
MAERNPSGYWEGQLSDSPLSTATAVMALEMFRRNGGQDVELPESVDLEKLIQNGLQWLANHQNEDGGWGDTLKSLSNIATSMLAHAVFVATDSQGRFESIVCAAQSYIDRTGGVEAVLTRYGKDRTFSIPILTHCALAGSVDWKDVVALPFEIACIPSRFYKMAQMPVVSYALPALIAIGQVRYHFVKPSFPLRWIRRKAIGPSLRVLERIQPSNGGFLEAAPLTSFVTMSLAAMGLVDHAVTRRGIQFLCNSVGSDGSWPIDTNLATWVTTLSVNALGDELPESSREPIRTWLLEQQYQDIHPYTDAEPGGWAWTDLPGGVPDADDTPGAMLAIINLRSNGDDLPRHEQESLTNAVRWLLGLQNRNGGWPTFCRGWGKLPFDRSSADITAHTLRALTAWIPLDAAQHTDSSNLHRRVKTAIHRGFRYLEQAQRDDGSWLPLWFGNQFAQNDENTTYGTARVLASFRDSGRRDCSAAKRGIVALERSQNSDGGWGGAKGIESSVEETALAVEILLSFDAESAAGMRGLAWLMDRIESGEFRETTPIGFYFAKLWYFERLYPIIFTFAAMNRASLALTRKAENPTGIRQQRPILG